MKYLNTFDGAFYINLDRRIDRRESFEAKAKDVGLIIPRFSAIEDPSIPEKWGDSGWWKKISCTLSHQECVRIAKQNQWETCLIFEDDAIFDESFVEESKKVIDDLLKLEWDMFFFGGEPASDCETITENIVKTNGVYGAHAYAVHSNFYDKILSCDPHEGLIDMYYINSPIHDKKFYLSRKLLVWQDDDKYPSDLWIKSGTEQIYRNAYKIYIN